MKTIVAFCLSLIAASGILFVDQASAFGPCQKKMPKEVSYIPKLPICGNKAAVVLTGRFYNSFSVVARDCANGDRDPCHRQIGSCGTNASSPFKVQKIVNAMVQPISGTATVRANIHCLKEAGDSLVYKLMVRRLTIKLHNPASSPSDIAKICLANRAAALNEVKIVKVLSSRVPRDLGFTRACLTQGYLNCAFAKSSICKGR